MEVKGTVGRFQIESDFQRRELSLRAGNAFPVRLNNPNSIKIG